MVGMGDGGMRRDIRGMLMKGSSIIHVDNIHLEYANTAYSTQCEHIQKALGTFKSGDKRGHGVL